LLKVLDRYFVFTKIPNQARYLLNQESIMFWFLFCFYIPKECKRF